VFRDAFGLSDDVAALVAAAHDWPSRHERDRTYLLLRCEGVPVATAMLHSTYGVAGVYGITVRRAHRRQGLGALATLATVRAGADRGATIAMLQATQEGFPVYERLGFRTICAFRSWQIP
jgi:GNAT superfamily N-acetyltransferase